MTARAQPPFLRPGIAFLVATFLAAAGGTARAQPVVLNELQAANETTVTDPDFGRAADWIELHNRSASAVDLGGWHLSDDADRPDRWRIPDGTVIGPGAYLVIWADGENTGLHAAFALDRDGEQVLLSDPSGAVADQVTFGPMADDVSFGRDPDTGLTWHLLLTPTPGAPNTGTPYEGLLDPPAWTLTAGFHFGPQQVGATAPDPAATVRYTTDGSVPTEASPALAAPLTLTVTTVLRAAAFRPGYAPSRTVTATYFIDEVPSLPVVSLSTDPAHFFDDETGIYVVGTNGIPGYCRSTPHNWNQDWERPIHVEFFEPDGTAGFAMDAGVKIFGGCTRIYDQKSLALYARRAYGPGRIDYPVFPWLDVTSFESLVLRSSAQDWWRTMFRDGMIQTLITQGMSIDTQAYRPALVFLNGEYWGIHNLREKLNEHYFADHYGLDPAQIEILQNDKDPINGFSAHFDAMMAFVRSADVLEPDALDVLAQWVDVDAYLDYLVAEIYSANGDWPGNNLKLWRPATPEGRWRWVIYDMDMGFGGNNYGQTGTNTLAYATSTQSELWSNPPWSTEQLRRLLLNDRFRHRFIQRMAAHISTTFDPDHVIGVIDSLQARIAAEIPRHKARWPKSISYGPTWDFQVDIMRSFARGRPLSVRGHFQNQFTLPGSARLHLAVEPAGAGSVEAAGVRMPTGGAGPVFFRGVPLSLEAVPEDGYRFVRWEGTVAADTDSTSVVLTGESWATAVFAPLTTAADEAAPLPVRDRLGQSFPNPASASVRIAFETARPGPVTLSVFDMLGRRVAAVDAGFRMAGRHEVALDASGLAGGVYVYTLSAPGFRASRSMSVVR